MRRVILSILVFGLIAGVVSAEITVPRASPGASVTQMVGPVEVTINYHRPGVKGRTIWEDLVPYGKIWRLGANEATTISFGGPVVIAGKEIPAGEYAMFAIPGADKWTLILNQNPEQWGVYGYEESKDQIRFEVSPVEAPHVEWMRFTIEPEGSDAATVQLNWKGTAVPFQVKVDTPAIVWGQVDESLKAASAESAQLYAQAAGFALEEGERLDDAIVWIDRSIAIQEGPFNLRTKALLLQKLGRADEALPLITRAREMAGASGLPGDFLELLDREKASIAEDAAP